MKYTLFFRKQIEVNTDPQRRCYNGCHASSEIRWTNWAEICTYSSKNIAEDSAKTFKEINKKQEYLVLPKCEIPKN